MAVGYSATASRMTSWLRSPTEVAHRQVALCPCLTGCVKTALLTEKMMPPSWRRERALGRLRLPSLAILIAFIAACEARLTEGDGLPVINFQDLFEIGDSVVLEQTNDYPIVGLEGFDATLDGRMVIADAGEARITIFASDGTIVRSIGRRGDGPGEFRFPSSPRFDTHGRIHVVDIPRHRIYVFLADGTLVREISTPSEFPVFDMELTFDGYLVAGHPPAAGPGRVLLRLDSLGTVMWEEAAIHHLRPQGERESRWWNTLRSYGISLGRDTIFLTSALFDSVWVLPNDDPARVSATAITVEGYSAPSMPEDDPQGPEGIRAWVLDQMRTLGVQGDAGLLIVPFTKHPYLGPESVPGIAALRDPEGRWWSVRDTPVVLRVLNGTVFTLDRPDLERFVIRTYTWRGVE